MDKRTAPMLLPAAGFAAGSLLAFELSYLTVPLLAALALLAFALRRTAFTCLAFFSLGLLAAAVRLGLPADPAAGLIRESPVEAVVRVAGHWSPDDDGWSAPCRLLRLRQGEAIRSLPLEVAVHLPGPEEPPPPFGSTLRIRGYLSRSPGFANRIPVPPGPWRLRVKSRQLLEVEAQPGWIDRLSGSLRRRVEEAYQAVGPGSEGERQGKALARALVLGDAGQLPVDWKRGLRVTGVYHLLSVSGVHVALVAGAVWLLGAFLPRRLRLLAMLAVSALYLLLVGPLPAMVRSAVMAWLAVLALLAERPPAAANALGWAVILLVLDRPEVVQSPAFQLTVSATVGLLLLAPPLAARWRSRWAPGWLTASLAASVSAQLATLPWALPRFYLLSPAALLLNLPAVPWTGLTLAASLVWTLIALASPSLAAWLLPALDHLAVPFAWPAHTPPGLWCSLPVAIPLWGAWLLAACLGLALLLPPRLRALRLAAALCAGAGLWAAAAGAGTGRRGPELAMLDVGQGDSILLRDGGRAILVDGGGWDNADLGGRVLLPALLGEGVHRLEAVVMTHPDRDHCGGLVDVSSYLPVKEVWSAPGWEPKGCAGRLLSLPGLRHRFLSRGQHLALGRWRLTVLHPQADGHRATNERSLVLLASVHGRKALLTGDIERQSEHELADCCAPALRTDVLKVAHHGSRTSSTASFLEAATPRLALISAGVRNVYHHPSPEVVARLQEGGAHVLRTDRSGEILLAFGADGKIRIATPGEPK
ncbi:MAG TPA: DNA internalization-related competence protein ComEC/Rec2 [Thermoanaerobaculia bacterium]|nr:DNA internalization-related competence protein ComEC/Rec2 [Thermoanaerobaculia bacterium]